MEFIELVTMLTVPVLAIGAVVLLVTLLLSRRGMGGQESQDGFSSFEKARKVKADAYLLAIDIDSDTLKWIPLKDMGTYYLFLTRKTGRFLPIDRRPLNVAGKPVFVGIKTSSTSAEVSIPLSVLSNVAKLRDREMFYRSPSFLSTIRKLYEKILEGEPSASETAESSMAVDIDYTGLFMQCATFVAKAFEKTMDSARSYLVSSFERGEDIERRGVQPEQIGRFLIYIAFAGLIGVVALIIYHFIPK